MRALLLLTVLAIGCHRSQAAPPAKLSVLRVCADGNNLPFSNEKGEGLENALAKLVADDLGAKLEYTYWPQRRGFFRTTLKANQCDVVMSVPKGIDHAKTTKPYYTSSFVFVTKRDVGPIASFDDPRLKTLKVGVPVGGDDGANPPPAHALARRGITENVKGYTLFGDYTKPNPPLAILEALDRGEIDVAIVWGPFGGYWAKHHDVLVTRPTADKDAEQPLRFAIAMGVRRSDDALKKSLDDVIERRRTDVDAILDAYGVPR